MSTPSSSGQNGKGSKQRPGKPGAYAKGYDAIDWSKGRKPSQPRKPTVADVLIADYSTKPEWVIPDLLGEPCDHPGCLSHVTHPCEGCGRVAGKSAPRAVEMCSCGVNPATPSPHGCPYQEEINEDSTYQCDCCDDCRHQCCMDI